jgi:hypothetical protein
VACDRRPRLLSNEGHYANVIPPPKVPLVRYHGLLAPHAKMRRLIVPVTAPRAGPSDRVPTAPTELRAFEGHRRAPSADPHGSLQQAQATHPTRPLTVLEVDRSSDRRPEARSSIAKDHRFDPPRTRGGQRIDWATLLRHVYDVDALQCGDCGGRLRVIAAITEQATIRSILNHVGEPTEGPTLRRSCEPWACPFERPPPDE